MVTAILGYGSGWHVVVGRGVMVGLAEFKAKRDR